MNLTSAKAGLGLSAVAANTGTNVSGKAVIGQSFSEVDFSDADIAYSFKVTATGASDVATLTLATGAVAQTTGTPTITDGDGKDFEGVTLPTGSELRAILATRSAADASFLRAELQFEQPGVSAIYWRAELDGTGKGLFQSEISLTDTRLTIKPAHTGRSVTIVILAKSS